QGHSMPCPYGKEGDMKTLENLTLSANEKSAIREATRMLKEKFPIKDVFLFGSKARGDDDPDSDIDLLLVAERPLHWKERQAIIHALFDLGMKRDVIFSILDTTETDFDNGIFTLFPIYQEIIREGVAAL
ncbi:MAG: nucleotidyltransferase domain-containing protein, partial [Desulfatiglandales bacterium]